MKLTLRTMPSSLLSVLLGILLVVSANPVSAQTTTSSIRVAVTDQNGAAVEGVSVQITHIPTQRTKTEISNRFFISFPYTKVLFCEVFKFNIFG